MSTQSRMNDAARQRVQQALASGKDEANPAFLYSVTATSLLLAIAHGLIDPIAAAKSELANRGLDQNGQWVGFDQARRIWGVTK